MPANPNPLREKLSDLVTAQFAKHQPDDDPYNVLEVVALDLLSKLDATAQQFVERIEREALEAALDRVSRLPGDRFGRLPAWGSADLRAAILGEK